VHPQSRLNCTAIVVDHRKQLDARGREQAVQNLDELERRVTAPEASDTDIRVRIH
jgi:hypothetical protein